MTLIGSKKMASPRPFLPRLSTARLTRMATAVLELTYFNPIISQEKPQFLPPGHIDSKICEESSGAWLIHNVLF
jgi:hypothetical protein